MLPLLRAELRKLTTVRSTYLLAALGLVLMGFLAFWVLGYRSPLGSPFIVMEAVKNATMAISVFLSVIAILLVAHEYRFNTIMYTLTASNSRSKVLLAKVLTVFVLTVLFTLFAIGVTAALALLGANLGRDFVAAQEFHYVDVIWRTLFYIVGSVMSALLIAVLFRHVVGAIVTYLIVPTTIEGLLGLLLKENTKYLPFSSLEQVNTGSLLSPGKAALIFSAYLVVGWIVAWVLFLRRDAN
jgi:ABC-type transport system involved in multi-copper enzyme maturation permease subunit